MTLHSLTAVTVPASKFSEATETHSDVRQRWILHQQGAGDSDVFTVSSALDGRYISETLGLTQSSNSAQTFTFTDLGNGKGYSIGFDGWSIDLGANQQPRLVNGLPNRAFSVLSVTYHS